MQWTQQHASVGDRLFRLDRASKRVLDVKNTNIYWIKSRKTWFYSTNCGILFFTLIVLGYNTSVCMMLLYCYTTVEIPVPLGIASGYSWWVQKSYISDEICRPFQDGFPWKGMSEPSYHKCGLWVCPNFSVKFSRNPWFNIRSTVESSSHIGCEDLTLRFVNFWPEIPEPWEDSPSSNAPQMKSWVSTSMSLVSEFRAVKWRKWGEKTNARSWFKQQHIRIGQYRLVAKHLDNQRTSKSQDFANKHGEITRQNGYPTASKTAELSTLPSGESAARLRTCKLITVNMVA